MPLTHNRLTVAETYQELIHMRNDFRSHHPQWIAIQSAIAYLEEMSPNEIARIEAQLKREARHA